MKMQQMMHNIHATGCVPLTMLPRWHFGQLPPKVEVIGQIFGSALAFWTVAA
jgi:hypothetical protein